MIDKEEILNFLNAHPAGVVSTISVSDQTIPSSATVITHFRSDFSCVFMTSVISKKYENISANPNVSVVIGVDGKDPYTFQYRGLAKGYEKGQGEYLSLLEELEKARPELTRYLHLPQIAIVVVAPKWIRYSKTDEYPAQITEFEL